MHATVTIASLLTLFLGGRVDADVVPPSAAHLTGEIICDSAGQLDKLFILENKGFQCMPNPPSDPDITFTTCFLYINDKSAAYVEGQSLRDVKDLDNSGLIFPEEPADGYKLFDICNIVLDNLKASGNTSQRIRELFSDKVQYKLWEDIESEKRVQVFYERTTNDGTKMYQRVGHAGEVELDDLPEGTTCQGPKPFFVQGNVVFKCAKVNDPTTSPEYEGCANVAITKESVAPVTYFKGEILPLYGYAKYRGALLANFPFEMTDAEKADSFTRCKELFDAGVDLEAYNEVTKHHEMEEVTLVLKTVEFDFFAAAA